MADSAHVSRFTLERRLAQELGAAEEEQVGVHVGACEACAKRWAELLEDQHVFVAQAPYAAFRVEHERRRAQRTRTGVSLWRVGRRWWLPAAAACGALLLLVPRYPHREGPEGGVAEDTQLKGDAVGLSFLVADIHDIEQGASGQDIPRRARLQFLYDAGAHTHMGLWSIDASATLTRYYPEEGASLALLPDGASGGMPFSLTLDSRSGVERFYAVFAPGALDVAALERALRTACAASVETPAAPQLPEGAAYATVWVRKP